MAKTVKQASGKPAKVALAATVLWTSDPADKDYPAAASYLRLLATDNVVESLVTALAHAPTVQQHAKDILRASQLALLPIDDAEVEKDLARVAAGTPLSPVLLVRGQLSSGRPLQIADGYHRVCASYHLAEDTDIPCRLVDLVAGYG